MICLINKEKNKVPSKTGTGIQYSEAIIQHISTDETKNVLRLNFKLSLASLVYCNGQLCHSVPISPVYLGSFQCNVNI